jgi:hypothetical protein
MGNGPAEGESFAAAKPVSALSTGGAGTIYEYRVAGITLAALLRGDHVPGLPDAVERVALQQRNDGAILDDIVAEDGAGHRVEIQVKRTIDVVASNEAFASTLRQCHDTLRSRTDEILNGRLRMGVAADGLAEPLKQLARVCKLAAENETIAGFHAQTAPAALGALERGRLDHATAVVRNQLTELEGAPPTDDAVDQVTHQILGHLTVWLVDEHEDNTDIRNAKDRVGDLLDPGGGVTASTVFSVLCDIAEGAGPQGGSFSRSSLRTKLEAKGIGLATDPNLAQHVDAVARHLDFVLAESKRDLGDGLALERTETLDEFVRHLAAPGIVVVSGSAGAGKSVLARRALEQAAATGAHTAAVNLTGRGTQTIATLNADITGELRLGLDGAPTDRPRVLLVDGAEQLTSDNGNLLAQLLRELPRDEAGNLTWTVALVSRADAAPLVKHRASRSLAYVGDATSSAARPVPVIRELVIGDLTDEEVELVLHAFPALEPLRRHPRGMRILRRPYLIDVLLRSAAELPETGALGEEGVVQIYWDDIVRQREIAGPRGHPDPRADICAQVAEHLLTTLDAVPLHATDPIAMQGLQSDEIIARVHDRYRFGHDVLADYSCAYLLAAEHNRHIYAMIPSPRRTIRAVRLAFQHRLTSASDNEILDVWLQILADAADLQVRDGPRWKDVPYEALLGIGDPDRILRAVGTPLAVGSAGTLWALIAATRRVASQQITQFRSARAAPVAKVDPLIAGPVVSLLITLGPAVPEEARPVALALTRDLLVTREPQQRVSFDPTLWGDVIAGWVGADAWGVNVEAGVAALGLFGHLSTAASELVARISRDRSYDLDNLVEDPDIVETAADLNPDLVLAAARAYYLNRPFAADGSPVERAPDDHLDEIGFSSDEDEGVREHSVHFRNAFVIGHPSKGAFQALLNASVEHGLALIADVVEQATAARLQLESRWGDQRITIALNEGGNLLGEYTGTQAVFQWVRRTSVGPDSALSALMALRDWAIGRRDIESLAVTRDRILGLGNSIAYVATAYSVLVAHLDEVVGELDPFLEQPTLWHSEVARSLAEHGGTAHQVPAEQRTALGPHDVAAYLVVAHPERHAQLTTVAATLIANAEASARDRGVSDNDLTEDGEVLVATRWAYMLDRNNWNAKPSNVRPDVIELSAEPPQELTDKLAQGGGDVAVASLKLNELQHRAMVIRDNESTDGDDDIDGLWVETGESVERYMALDPDGDYAAARPNDLVAAVAAAVIVIAHSGGPRTNVSKAAGLALWPRPLRGRGADRPARKRRAANRSRHRSARPPRCSPDARPMRVGR